MNLNEIISSGLLESFVLGKTNEQENAQVLAWKATYPEVAVELLAIENDLEMFDFANAVKPSENLKKNIFAGLKSETNINAQPLPVVEITSREDQVQAPVVKTNFWKYAAAASVALLITGTVVNYNKYNTISDKLAKAESEIANQKQEIASLNEGVEGAANNSSQQVVLKGTPTSPTSTAKIFWVRNSGEVFVEASGLPTAPQGSQYQLWAIIDGKPVDAGMIISDKKGKKYNIQKMKSFGNAQAFAITLEKEGGSPTPTMEKMYVMSSL